MIDAVIKSSLILLTTACWSWVLRKQSAALRHMVWTAGLILALIVPVPAHFLPAWDIELPAQSSLPLSAVSTVVTVVGSSIPAEQSARPLDIVFYVWLAGVGLGALWLMAGASRLTWIAFQAKPLNSERWAAALSGVARTLQVRRPIRLMQNDRVAMLGAWGIFRGHILLPQDAGGWPDERIRVVLGHEVSHIRRNDWLIQIVAECARLFYWFNPLFWLLCARLRRESEHACDDAVLRLGIDGQTYAAHLLDLARTLKTTDAAWSPVLAMAQCPHLERRFIAMLNPSLNHHPASVAAVVLVAIVGICLSLPLAAMRSPQAVEAGFGSLSGTAYDPSGAVILGVTVQVTNLQTKTEQTVTTDAAGDFQFQGLPSGDYSFRAAVPGFTNIQIARLAIRPNQNTRQNANLIVGNISEAIVVTAVGPPKPQTLLPAGTPRRIRVGGNVSATRLLHQVKPVYPPNAQNTGVEGTVRLQGIIAKDGSLQGLRVLSSIDADLSNAALEAVRQWRYAPTLLNGVPVETLTNIDVEFRQPTEATR